MYSTKEATVFPNVLIGDPIQVLEDFISCDKVRVGGGDGVLVVCSFDRIVIKSKRAPVQPTLRLPSWSPDTVTSVLSDKV